MREGERERKRGLKLARIFSGLQLVVAFLKLADFVHLQLRAITCVCVLFLPIAFYNRTVFSFSDIIRHTPRKSLV